MTIDLDKLEVAHDPEAGRFQIEAGRWMAVLNYEMEGNVMVFYSYRCPAPLMGQALAEIARPA
jgi:hypothetical protein